MEFRQVLTILRDLFMPQPRNACPHCGGIRCIGACQFNDKPPVESGRDETGQAQQGQAPAGDKNLPTAGQDAAGQSNGGNNGTEQA